RLRRAGGPSPLASWPGPRPVGSRSPSWLGGSSAPAPLCPPGAAVPPRAAPSSRPAGLARPVGRAGAGVFGRRPWQHEVLLADLNEVGGRPVHDEPRREDESPDPEQKRHDLGQGLLLLACTWRG